MDRHLFTTVVLAVCLGFTPATSAQQPPVPPGSDPLHRALDQILDVNVRDGLVYYRALQGARGALDRYVASLNVPAATYDGWSRDSKMAFWVNAYNAFVLQTVINHYPIQRHEQRLPAVEHPADSGRVRPDEAPGRGAERDARRDREDDPPRVQGAAAVPGARPRRRRQRPAAQRGVHRGAPARAARSIQAEFVTEQQHAQGRPRSPSVMSTTPILSWREAEFVAAYGGKAARRSRSARRSSGRSSRSSRRTCCRSRRSWSTKNQFKVTFQEFDWRLNDLTGGRVD